MAFGLSKTELFPEGAHYGVCAYLDARLRVASHVQEQTLCISRQDPKRNHTVVAAEWAQPT